MRRTTIQSGFTLIEMIVSLALFSVVITISVGALLILIATNRQLQDDQNILTNLSFALDSMTREIRTGSGYFCESRTNLSAGGPNNIFSDGNNQPVVTDNDDCFDGRPAGNSGNIHGVSFVEGGDSITGSGSDRIVYFHDRSEAAIFRRVGSGDAEPITSSNLYITEADFFVSGTEPRGAGGPGRVDQPTVTIFLEAAAQNPAVNPNGKRYQIQTTVVQRSLDL